MKIVRILPSLWNAIATDYRKHWHRRKHGLRLFIISLSSMLILVWSLPLRNFFDGYQITEIILVVLNALMILGVLLFLPTVDDLFGTRKRSK